MVRTYITGSPPYEHKPCIAKHLPALGLCFLWLCTVAATKMSAAKAALDTSLIHSNLGSTLTHGQKPFLWHLARLVPYKSF